MTINEKILEDFKKHCKNADYEELDLMINGLYEMHKFLYKICNNEINEFTLNSFPRKLKYIVTDCTLIAINERKKRRDEMIKGS